MILIADTSFEDKNSLETHQQTECARRFVEIPANVNDDSIAEGMATELYESGNESTSSDVKNDRTSERSGEKPKRMRQGDKKFECVYCRQKYAAETSLRKHIIDHGTSTVSLFFSFEKFGLFSCRTIHFHHELIQFFRSRWKPRAQMRFLSQIFQIHRR